MNFARKLGLAFGKTLILLSIIVSALAFLFYSTLSKPYKIKLWLSDSGLYQAIAESIQEQFIKDNNNGEQIPTTVIQDAIVKTFTAETAQNIFEDSVDSTYKWLDDGDQTDLALEINTDEIQQNFVANVQTGLLAEFSALPVCSSRTIPTSTNLLDLQCVPRGVDINQVVSSLVSQLDEQTSEQLNNGSVSLDTNSGSLEQPKNLAPDLKPLKDSYSLLGKLPYIAAGLFIFGAGLVIALNRPRYRTLRTLAVAAIPYGILYIASGIFLPSIVKTGTQSAINSIEEPKLRGPVEAVASNIGTSIGKDLINIGIVLLALGVILLVSYLIVRKKFPAKEEKTEKSHPLKDQPKIPTNNKTTPDNK